MPGSDEAHAVSASRMGAHTDLMHPYCMGVMPPERVVIEPVDVRYLGIEGAGLAFIVRGAHGAVPVALVETGPAVCMPWLQRGIARAGIAAGDVRDVLVTHVHLDHAGAAGHVAAHGAHVHVHPRGQRHLVEPARLIAGTRAVHGMRFESEYGDPLPVPAGQAHAVEDGGTVQCAGGIVAEAMATPGHARHHHAWIVRDAARAHAFVGDVAGILLPHPGRFLAVPMPPTDLDLTAWIASIARLEAMVSAESRAGRAVTLWLTHGGAAEDAASHLRLLRSRLEEEHALCATLCDIGLVPDGVPSPEAVERYAQWLWPRADGCAVPNGQRAAFLGHAFMRMNLAGVAHERARGRAAAM